MGRGLCGYCGRNGPADLWMLLASAVLGCGCRGGSAGGGVWGAVCLCVAASRLGAVQVDSCVLVCMEVRLIAAL